MDDDFVASWIYSELEALRVHWVGILILYHVHWTGFFIGVVFTSQHLQQKFMEEMCMHHLFEYAVLTLLLVKLLGGMANFWVSTPGGTKLVSSCS
jgi:Ni,Fe-hydrogenase I cytochrome b subunit